MNKFKGYIYLIKNIYNNKIYIGQSVRPNRRIYEHFDLAFKKPRFYIHYAIKKYGKHNFTWRILGECSSKKELDEAEKECIIFFKSNNSIYGYNLTEGGEGCIGYKHSEETKKRISKSNTGHLVSNETKNKLSIFHTGKKLSKETKEKLRKLSTGKKLSKEARMKISESNRRRKLSDETKLKISKSNTGKIRSNEFKENIKQKRLGVLHSEETKRKISESHKRKNNEIR